MSPERDFSLNISMMYPFFHASIPAVSFPTLFFFSFPSCLWRIS